MRRPLFGEAAPHERDARKACAAALFYLVTGLGGAREFLGVWRTSAASNEHAPLFLRGKSLPLTRGWETGKRMRLLAGLGFMGGLMPGLLGAAELQADTLKAWDAYVRNADTEMRARLSDTRPFLWTDESDSRRRDVGRGEIVVAPVLSHGAMSAPSGLIHHWIGAVFIPHSTIERLVGVLHDYNRYKDFYKPVIADSRFLGCNREDPEFSMTWHRHVLFVNAAMEGRCHARRFAVNRRRGYSVAEMTQLREIEQYGHPGEHALPSDTGHGFIWRLHDISRYEEREGGVYLEVEAIALTRDIPASFRWLVSPIVKHLSFDSMETMLRQTRNAVSAAPAELESVGLCPNEIRSASEARGSITEPRP